MFVLQMIPWRKWKNSPQNERKYPHAQYLIRALFLEYINISYNLIIKWQVTQFFKCVKSLNRDPKKDMQMNNEHMKRYSTLLILREMQIKITVRCHFTLIRMAIIEMTDKNFEKSCRETGTIIHCWWERKMVQPFWKRVLESSNLKA